MRDNYGGVLKSENLIKKEAKGTDNTDLGEIKDITSNSIITEMNNTYKDKFIIPKDLVERFHEDSVLFQITEKETERYKQKRINLLFISEKNNHFSKVNQLFESIYILV